MTCRIAERGIRDDCFEAIFEKRRPRNSKNARRESLSNFNRKAASIQCEWKERARMTRIVMNAQKVGIPSRGFHVFRGASPLFSGERAG